MATSLGAIGPGRSANNAPGYRARASSVLRPKAFSSPHLRPVMLATSALGLLAAVLLAVSWMLFARLVATDRAIIASVREDAMWATYQADRHGQTLKWQIDTAILTKDADRFDDILAAYDILYSRAILLERGAFSIDLGDETGISGISIRGADLILDLAAQFDAIDPAAPDLIGQLRAMQPVTDQIAVQMADLTLRSNAALSSLRVEERSEQRRNFIQLGIGVGLIVVVFLGIAVLLTLQLRQNLLANRRMVLLRERSRKQARRAHRANAAKSTFLATMSHEIRTPLNGILGMAETLSLGTLGPEQQRQVGVIRTAGGLLLDVINDILDFSRLESGKVRPNLEAIDLALIAETLRSVLTPSAEQKGLRLTVDLPQGRVVTDPGRLRQIAVNLTGNAIKFTDHGIVTVSGVFLDRNRLRVEVRDTGVGIARESLPLLFRDFSQVDGTFTRRFGGTGLGLAICKRLAEGMGGAIGVESSPGKGSLFWFELPVTDAGAMPEPDVSLTRLTGRGSFRGQVLVVEDNPINREVLIGLLTHLGLDAESVNDGQAAVDAVAARAYDIVLMDMQMPRKSGIEATQDIRLSGNSVPIAGVTANAFTSNQRDCERAGMNDFLAKPVTLDRLAALLQRQGVARVATSADAAVPVSAPRSDDDFVAWADAARQPAAGTPEHLQALAAIMGVDAVARLIAQFAADLDRIGSAMANAIAAGNRVALDRHLHAFKGASGSLGFAALAAQVQTLRESQAPDATTCAALITTARRAVADVRL